MIYGLAKQASAIGIQFHSLLESGSANVDYGADGAIRLFPFERGSEAIGASIKVLAERCRLDDHCVPPGKAKDRWGCEFRTESATIFAIVGVKSTVAPFLGRAVIGRMRWAMLGRNLW